MNISNLLVQGGRSCCLITATCLLAACSWSVDNVIESTESNSAACTEKSSDKDKKESKEKEDKGKKDKDSKKEKESDKGKKDKDKDDDKDSKQAKKDAGQPVQLDSGTATSSIPDSSPAPTDSSPDTNAQTVADVGTDTAPETPEAAPPAPPPPGFGGGFGATCLPAVKLTHANARMTFPQNGMAVGEGNWTMETWVKPHDEYTGPSRIFDMNENYAAWGFRLGYENGKATCYTYNDHCPCGPGTANPYITSKTSITGTGWHHVACVRNGSNLSLWVDGILEGEEFNVQNNFQSVGLMSLGMMSGYIGQTGYQAAPVFIGPTRFSNVARYGTRFTPFDQWSHDSATVMQFLVQKSYDPNVGQLVDEVDGDNTGTSFGGVDPACQ